MGTIIVVIIVIFFGKFIWDSYLTNNTDKNWEKYKEENPEDAARIEFQSAGNTDRYSPQNKKRDINNLLKFQFPNFCHFCEIKKENVSIEFSKDNGDELEYKVPIITHNKVMGYYCYGVKKKFHSYLIYMNAVSMGGFKIEGKKIEISNDQTEEEYDEIEQDLITYLYSETKFMDIASGDIL